MNPLIMINAYDFTTRPCNKNCRKNRCLLEREKHTIRAYTNHGLLYQNTLIFGMVDYNIPYTYA